jgi:hypothetical protein
MDDAEYLCSDLQQDTCIAIDTCNAVQDGICGVATRRGAFGADCNDLFLQLMYCSMTSDGILVAVDDIDTCSLGGSCSGDSNAEEADDAGDDHSRGSGGGSFHSLSIITMVVIGWVALAVA